MGRPSNTDARREQITDALKTVMARSGYDGASVTDIAKAAGLAPGLVHYHFKSKLEILLGLLEQLSSEHHTGLETAIEATSGGAAKELETFIDFHLALERAEPETLACWLTISGEALRETRVRTAFDASLASTVKLLMGVIARGVKEGAFSRVEPKSTAAAIMAAIQGYYVLAATAPKLIPRGSAARSVNAMAMGLLAPARSHKLGGPA